VSKLQGQSCFCATVAQSLLQAGARVLWDQAVEHHPPLQYLEECHHVTVEVGQLEPRKVVDLDLQAA
jgi:hypothetical protein